MVIGSVLLQPRKVAQPPAVTNLTLLEDFLTLTVRLLWDRAHGGNCLTLFETALGNSLNQMLSGMKAGQAAALPKIVAWAKPFKDRLAALGQALPGDSVVHETILTGDQLVGLILQVLEGVTTDQLAQHLDFLLQILQNDLGLTNTFITQQISAIFDEIVKQLRAAPPEADLAARENRFEIMALVRRIRRQVEGEFTLPAINVDRLVAPMLAKLRELKYDDALKRADTVGKTVKSGLDLMTGISDEVGFSMGFSGGPGAAGAPASPGDKHAWYASWVAQDSISALDPTTAPALANYTFKNVSAADMEKVALHSKWITTLVDGILVAATGIKKGNYAITTLAILRDALYTLLAPLADIEFPSEAILGTVLDNLINLGIAALGSLEGRSFDKYDAVLYIFRLIFKFGGSSLPVNLLRDGLLSIMTLANHDATAAVKPDNVTQIDGLVRLFMRIVGPLIHAAVVPDNYFSINVDTKNAADNAKFPVGLLLAAVLLGALGMSIVSFFIGFLLSGGIAGAFPDAKTAAKSWAKGWALSHLNFIGFWFLINDGSTNDGKRGYTPDDGRGTEVVFSGYAPKVSSPYLMPFAGSAECVQGNHGFWSHNPVTNQDFAYDFSLNLGTEILCMRDGTVVAILDTVDDGDHSTDGNHVIVKHTTLNNDHDTDVGGGNKMTYAVYYHGQKGSIAAAGIAMNQVITQGRLIMSCNSTGMSRFNHIHIHVVTDDASNPGNPGKYSVPFVFKDADNDKGVPKSRTVYESSNTKKP